mgnify:FL=1
MLKFSEFLKKCETIGTDQYQESKFQSLQENSKSYNNIMSHIKGDRFVVIISVEKGTQYWADKKNVDIEAAKPIRNRENGINTQNFRSTLELNQISFTSIIGHYDEYVESPINGKTTFTVKEHSTICYGDKTNYKKLLELCIKWATKTHQDSILIAMDGKAWLYYTNDVEYTVKDKTTGKEITKHISAGTLESIGTFHFGRGGEDDCFTLLRSASKLHQLKNRSQERAFTFTTDKGKAPTALQKYFDGALDTSLKEDRY